MPTVEMINESMVRGTSQGNGIYVMRRNHLGNIDEARGTSVPASGSAGYQPGCKFTLYAAANGQCPEWLNIGTATSCLFVPVGPLTGYGFALAAGPVDCTNGNAATVITDNRFHQQDIPFAIFCVTDDTDNILSVAQTAGKQTFTITASADGATAHDFYYGALRNKIEPEWDIVAAGTRVAVAGDTTTVAITVTGAQVGDIAFATVIDTDDTDTIAACAVTANTVTLTVSADPVTEHTWAYVVLRPRGSFKPSHYIFAAGTHTTVGGAAAEAITVTGTLATDIAIVVYHTTNDTDTIVKAVCTANTLTVTMSADPSTAHKLSYMILRAYA